MVEFLFVTPLVNQYGSVYRLDNKITEWVDDSKRANQVASIYLVVDEVFTWKS